MPIDILMPALSPTMTEGTLTRWLKKEHDTVISGDVLAEIETDKATMEIEAIDEGTLGKILIPEGTEGVAVNTVIGAILEEGEDRALLDQHTQPTAKPEAAPKSATPPAASGGRVFASPLARRLAADKGLNLQQISGSGPHGRVILRDIEHAILQATTTSAIRQPMVVAGTSDLDAPSGFTRVPLSAMRKIIAQRLTESKQAIPHFYLSADCHIDKLLALRQEMNTDAGKADKISVNDLIVKACASALLKQPKANACFDDDAVRFFDHADIAVAVSIPDGLITPVIRRADQRSLSNISALTKDLAGRAREGKLTPEEYQGGSFTISNLGMFSVDQFQAVINPPHACILAVGRGRKTPIVLEDGSLGVGTVMNITLSVDHRTVDGAVSAMLLDELKLLIENPVKMLI
ncbi:MAG: 2-oxo acid dehydrogenase subunit E2 [Alphaproteobacteria bacterium]|nr:2-oxo acid dehydrogenase subunit E2 [Alphaproteobacteria bacterium]